MCMCAQSCLTLCDPKDGSTPDSPVHGDSPGKSIGVVCHFLLQGIFLTQEPKKGFPGGKVVKNPPANAGDSSSIAGSGRSPAEGNVNPFQNSCLENLMD